MSKNPCTKALNRPQQGCSAARQPMWAIPIRRWSWNEEAHDSYRKFGSRKVTVSTSYHGGDDYQHPQADPD